MLQTFVVYLNNRSGVLNRVSSVFRRFSCNIESLTVATHSEVPGLSRMTILTDAEDDQVRLLEANLKKLVDVIFLEVSVDLKVISRELVLIKVPMRDDFSLPGDLVKRYGLRLLERSLESMVLEATGTQKEVHELLKLLHPLRPVEIARSGRVAIPRTGSAFYRLRLEGVRIAGKPQ